MLAERGLTPRRRFGQNFLHDHNLLTRLVDASGVSRGDLVLEVGPGTGTLTESLLDRGAEVVAVEIDRDLAALLQDRLGESITLLQGDCMEPGRQLSTQVQEAIGGRPFRLVANLPYQIASPLMAGLVLEHNNWLGQWVTIQSEVADRLLAEPGTTAWGPLGIIIQAAANVKRLATLPAKCFWPAPKVTSAMVELVPNGGLNELDAHAFARFVTKLFSTRRKQLGGVLGSQVLAEAEIEPTWRCERVDIRGLKRLFEIVS